MSDELKNILSNLNPGVEQEKLLQYLNRELSDEERHELEKAMADDAFINDAVEGLAEAGNTNNIQEIVSRLNNNLRDQVKNQKDKRAKRRPVLQSWLYVSIILIILLAVVSYCIIRKFQSS